MFFFILLHIYKEFQVKLNLIWYSLLLTEASYSKSTHSFSFSSAAIANQLTSTLIYKIHFVRKSLPEL